MFSELMSFHFLRYFMVFMRGVWVERYISRLLYLYIGGVVDYNH